MKVNGRSFETIWIHPENPGIVQIIDQRQLPFEFCIENLRTCQEVYTAIRDMHLRGAPLIGAAGALGMYLAVMYYERDVIDKSFLAETAEYLKSSRPTAVNLSWAVDRVLEVSGAGGDKKSLSDQIRNICMEIIDEERQNCMMIGKYGLEIIKAISEKKRGDVVNILTHCNAGWLACIDYGTATAPVYQAHDKGIKVHVWVDETRPRNQGARLTAWELQEHGVPCTLIADNTGGLLMQQGMVDLVITGSDRASPYGDIVNKIGTYLKALAAKDNGIPFYAALPSSTIDWSLTESAAETPIEQRGDDEVKEMEGLYNGQVFKVQITAPGVPVANYGFDITPARLVTGIITERGISNADKKSIFTLFPEKNINPSTL